jgi:hypothetical protein
MTPFLAFGLIEVIIILAIIAIALILFGPAIAAAMKKARKATAGQTAAPTWLATPTQLAVDTPTNFNFSLTFSSSTAALPTPAPSNTPVLFDLVITKGTGEIVSVTVDGNALPQSKTATPGSPASDALGGTDSGGLLTVVIKLGEASAGTLTAHERAAGSPAGGWSVTTMPFSTP